MDEIKMSPESIVKALRRMASETGSLNCLGCGHEHSCSTHGCAVLKAAADMIEATGGWISVEDRLPSREDLEDTESEYVMVAEHYKGDSFEFRHVSICGFTKDGWSDWDSFGSVRPEKITHWMPLPEPPEGDRYESI